VWPAVLPFERPPGMQYGYGSGQILLLPEVLRKVACPSKPTWRSVVIFPWHEALAEVGDPGMRIALAEYGNKTPPTTCRGFHLSAACKRARPVAAK